MKFNNRILADKNQVDKSEIDKNKVKSYIIVGFMTLALQFFKITKV